MKKKTLAALALSATLAMGTVPAFAAVPSEGNTELGTGTEVTNDPAGGKATGNTTVSVKTVAMNISAKVPITMTVAAPAEGGELTVPANYKITNGSVYPIGVKVKADAAEADLEWTLTAETATNLSDPNKLNLKLQPTGVASAFNVGTTDSAEWKIDKKGDADTECAIAVSGSASKTALEVGVASKAVKLVYTIAPTTMPAPTA